MLQMVVALFTRRAELMLLEYSFRASEADAFWSVKRKKCFRFNG